MIKFGPPISLVVNLCLLDIRDPGFESRSGLASLFYHPNYSFLLLTHKFFAYLGIKQNQLSKNHLKAIDKYILFCLRFTFHIQNDLERIKGRQNKQKHSC